jgi:zinc transport system substrate-binding protein
VVTSHDSLGYLSRRYHFQTFSISGLSPDQEPSPQKMADITNLIKQLNVKYILTETLVSPKLANTLAIETKVNTLVFNPIEGLTTGELSANEDYLSVQEKNIKSLSTALECQKL